MADRTISVNLRLKLTEWQAGWSRATQTVKQGTEDLSRSVKKNKADLDSMARGFTTVGLVAGAGLAVAVKKFADFDKAMSNVKAATHETTGNMQLLRDAAIDAGARTAFSATEAAGAIENLAKAGVSTADILGGGLQGALDLAAAGELGVAQAAETAATAMTQFKLAGKDVPHIADLLAAGAGKAQGEVSDLAAALNQSGLVASQFGLSIEETVGTLSAFASAGLLGSDAGTSFKTMLLRLANPSGEAADVMQRLGINTHDASGEFIGIAPLAEQLKGKLGKLTAEQRDAALATIFGSDAIRAANVLYQNGAKGIADWTTKVDDAGFAAETAAIKQDNLRGDLEKLGGAFDTFLIKLGQGGNAPFRSLVQGATGLVDALGDLPPAAQQTALAVAGITAVAGLAAGGTLKAVTAANNLRTSWQNLGRTGKGLTLSMGAVGIALAAAATIYGVFATKNAEAKQRVQDLADTLDAQTGAITANTRTKIAQDLADQGLLAKAKDLNLNLQLVTDAALDQNGALDQLVGSLDRVIEAGTRHVVAGNRAGTVLTEEARAALSLKNELVGTNGALTDAQRKHSLTAEAAKDHKTAQELAAEAMQKASEKAREETQSLDALIESMHRASGAALTLSGSQIAYQAALDEATQSAKDNGKTLDLNTEKGRANRTALNNLAKTANEQSDAMLKSGRSNTIVAKTAEGARANLSKVAQVMGLSKPEADALAKSLIDIPKKVEPKVNANTTAAKKKADEIKAKIAALDKQKASPSAKVRDQASAQIAALQAQLRALNGTTATTTVVNRFITERIVRDQTTDRGHAPANADGGLFRGAGGPRSDANVTMISDGEFIVNARQTAKHLPLLRAINNGAEGFADGGLKGPGLATSSNAELRSLVASFKALQKSLDRNTKGLESTTDRIRALVQTRNEFVSQTTSSFTGGLFEQGSSVSDLNTRLQARRNDARGLQQSLATLRKKGLNAELYKQLAASSNYQAASELAAMTPAQLRQINASYSASQKAVAALGAFAGETAYGAQIRGQLSLRQREQVTVQAIQKAMNGVRVRIVKSGGESYLQAMTNS